MYHYITITAVMRNCDNETDARRQCVKLLPCHPDETTQHMESWTIEKVRESSTVETRDESGKLV